VSDLPPPPPPSGAFPPPPGSDAYGYQPYGSPGQPPNNYLVLGILTTVFCCLPLGIVSIINAAKVNSLWQSGQQAEAIKASERAKTFATVAALGGLLPIVLIAAITFLGSSADNTFSSVGTAIDVDDVGPPLTLAPPSGSATISGTPPTTVAFGAPSEPLCPPADGSAAPTHAFTGPFAGCLADADHWAVMRTTKGTIVVDLDEDEVPGAVEAFVSLARYHYYDGTALFRTDPSIDIIQGGSPHTQDNRDPGPGFAVEDEPADGFDANATSGPFRYQAGQLVLARSAGPDSSGGQFFFTTGPRAASLDSQGTYIVLGEVTEGLDVLEAIIALHVEDGSGLGGRPGEQ
jgi:cyclophilin family peptidyl-prolyl cis-trans isomerase